MPASPHGPTRFASEGHATKLNETLVREIKLLLREQVPAIAIAEQYGVSRDMIYKIKAGIRWAWVR